MLPRCNIFRRLQVSVRKVRPPSRRISSKDDPKMTMNDLPVPGGPWKDDYDRRNTKYNILLGSAIFTLITTISVANSLDIIQWNYKMPRLD